MTLNDLLTQAQVLAGYNDVSGDSVDHSFFTWALQCFRMALNDINNDSRLNIMQKSFDYAVDVLPSEEAPRGAAKEYPLPPDCRRVLRAFFNSQELEHTDFASIYNFPWTSMSNNFAFAVNDKRIFTTVAWPLRIVYIPEIPQLNMGDEIPVDESYLSYIVYKTAVQMAIAGNQPSAFSCKLLAEQALNDLLSTLVYNMGNQYQNPNVSLNRFNPIGFTAP